MDGSMQLILWRHADAENEAATDHARRLTEKGREQALRVASWLTGRLGGDLTGWRVLASPAVRAQQTALSLSGRIETVPSIAPDAPASAVLAAIGWPELSAPTIVVGHQPTLGMVAARLLNGVDGYVSIKKGAMWWFEVRERGGKHEIILRAMTTPESVM
jgi:phosphohistidine phosphatase